MISEYAVGTFGWVMQSVFAGLSLGCATLLVGLALNGPRSIFARLGVMLLSVASIGLVVSAINPMDLPGTPTTRTGQLHDLSFFTNVVSIFLAVVLLTASFGSDIRWASFRPASAILLSLIAFAFLVQFLTLRKGAPCRLESPFFFNRGRFDRMQAIVISRPASHPHAIISQSSHRPHFPQRRQNTVDVGFVCLAFDIRDRIFCSSQTRVNRVQRSTTSVSPRITVLA